MFSINKIAEISKIDNFEEKFEEIKDSLKKGKHYFIENDKISFSKNGVFRLALILEDENLENFIDKLEDYQENNISNIYKSISKVLKKFAENLENSDNPNIDEVDKFVEVLAKFSQISHNYEQKNSGNYADKISDFASGTRDIAYKFASKTEDDAYKFASNMGKDAYQFTSDTRDKAHDFVMKTEDDAYKFASNMGKDAYDFASKGMEFGYLFASRGMKYGYEFASKGEEVGEMANRVLWMASEIGIMADRIGEMSDRIVHTEHLIVQTAILIQNFGLLIDGTMKDFSEAILYGLSMLLEKEFKPLETSSKHLEIISEVTKEILKNNHEYDMQVLEKQGELRKITISALDKIGKDF